MRIAIDRDVCIGSGNCVRLARGVFVLDDEDVSTVADPTAADEDAIRLAETSCPTGAITVHDD